MGLERKFEEKRLSSIHNIRATVNGVSAGVRQQTLQSEGYGKYESPPKLSLFMAVIAVGIAVVVFPIKPETKLKIANGDNSTTTSVVQYQPTNLVLPCCSKNCSKHNNCNYVKR
uniref:Uncharacterized protein n=1 Tax=Glossina pallidipes TaxID=7398 RepID=A0A1A9ZF70_GLOPL